LLFWFVNKTLIGKQMRAVAFDKSAASLMGINIDVVISTAFIVGPALAGAGGILYGTTYGMLGSPFLGTWPGLKAFIAAVLGGIGNIPGAVLGAYIMGISEAFATSIDSNLGYGIAFAILIGILLVKPGGLLGKFMPEKV
ncbi:MAG: branched-chain amino acid ABC transporter permease, partial [Caldisericota bacterium]|nr:branched-chain amino acid ABC transporter permease [Caldisericota bacterium]